MEFPNKKGFRKPKIHIPSLNLFFPYSKCKTVTIASSQTLLKLAEQIQALLSQKKVNKKALQSCLGLLILPRCQSHSHQASVRSTRTGLLQATPTKPLSDPRLLQCLSAADAMAEGDKVGLGGWRPLILDGAQTSVGHYLLAFLAWNVPHVQSISCVPSPTPYCDSHDPLREGSCCYFTGVC